jgi:hypothetical protein
MRLPACAIAIAVVAAPALASAHPDDEVSPPEPSFDSGREWNVEARFGALYASRRALDVRANVDAEVGAMASLGFSRRLPYKTYEPDHGCSLAKTFAALFTLGIAAIPPSVWYGTDIGAAAEFHYRAGLTSHRDRWVAAVRPTFRVSPPGTRVRFPALVSVITPALGVALDTPRADASGPGRAGTDASLYVGPQLFSIGVLVDRHAAIDIEPAAPVMVRFRDGKADVHPTISATVSFR